jgi:hypothetical protein
MPTTEAQRRASKAYLARIKGTPQGERRRDMQRASQRKYCNERYHTDEEFKEAHKEKMLAKYAPDKALQALRYLFQ